MKILIKKFFGIILFPVILAIAFIASFLLVILDLLLCLHDKEVFWDIKNRRY